MEWSAFIFRNYGDVVFWRSGFTIEAEHALESITKRVHAVTCQNYRMSLCGLGATSTPMEFKRVRDRSITCKRCLTLLFLSLSREGKLGCPVQS